MSVDIVRLSNDYFSVNGEILPLRVSKWSLQDSSVVLTAALVLFCLRHILAQHVFKPYATKKLGMCGSRVLRFSENAWFSLYYVALLIAGIAVLGDASWLMAPETSLLGFPHFDADGPTFESTIRNMYLIQMGFYFQAIFGLVFIDERMKDFYQMVIHHVATIGLVVLSLVSGFYRFGSLVLLLHDTVDVFLYVGKTLHDGISNVGANICFVFFVLSYAVLRLGLLPYMTFLAYSSEGRHRFASTHYGMYTYDQELAHIPFEVSSYGVCVGGHCLSTYWFSWYFLLVLLALHCFWFTLVVKLVIKTIKNSGDVPGDLRQKDFDDRQARLKKPQPIEEEEEQLMPSTSTAPKLTHRKYQDIPKVSELSSSSSDEDCN